MAPIEPDAVYSNFKPLAIFGSQAAVVAFLIAGIARFLYNVSDDLPPAYHTRRRSAKNQRHVALYSTLFALSLLVTVYHSISWRVASYRDWAQQSNLVAPSSVWQGWYAQTDKKWHLGRWIGAVDLSQEVDHTLFRTSRAYWWTYQQFVALVTWSVFVGIEGSYRNIPQYITLSFVVLAELGSLSLASSLYFLTLVVTHVPLEPKSNAQRLGFLTPHPVMLLAPALATHIWLYYLPRFVESSIWSSMSTIGYFIVPLLLALLAQPNYVHRLAKHADIGTARLSYTGIFRVLAWASFSLHIARSFTAILDNTPPQRELHFNPVWSMHTEVDHNIFDHTLTVLSKIFGALNSNPIIASVGWDVLLTELTFFTWSITRSLDARAMLRSAGLLWSQQTSEAISAKAHSAAETVGKKAKAIARKVTDSDDEESDSSDNASAIRTVEDEFEELIQEAERRNENANGLRRSTRDRFRKSTSQFSPVSPTFPPLSGSGASSVARRGAHKRQASANMDDDDEAADREYSPTPATQRDVSMTSILHEDNDDVLEETEVGALTWGLFVVGGLGVAAAGVLGAEVGGGK